MSDEGGEKVTIDTSKIASSWVCEFLGLGETGEDTNGPSARS
jgi:hypothetical protein